MVWCSGWKMAKAVCDAGGLGVIGAGSMKPEVFEEHLQKITAAGVQNFGVNLPLFYARIEEQIALLEKYKVPIVITSAGSPKTYTQSLKENGVVVLHVVSSVKFALKAQEAGVNAIVAEGFEAGGHNGRDELTTLVLLQLLKDKLDIPFIAAGGIGTGSSILAAMALGAEAVQVGSLFAASMESSAHINYKNQLINADESATTLTLKELMPVRLLKNPLYQKFQEAYNKNATADELKVILGKGRSRLGIFEGDVEEGELEVGQVTALINEIRPVAEIMENLINDYNKALATLQDLKSL